MKEIIAALELGTSKSIALLAQKDFSGKFSVLRTETLVSKDAIRRGRVYNLDETSSIVSKLIGKLNSNPALQVEKIYVGVGGQSLHTQLFSKRKTVEGGIITKKIIDLIEEEANTYSPELEENLGVCSCEYYVDGRLVPNPKGIAASVIEARIQLVMGNPCLKRNLKKVFDEKGISVAGYFISPLATAEAVLTPEEKEWGCALVEIGEGVTYISVYKNKALKYMITLPLGGLAITNDILSNSNVPEAEMLKIKHGSVIPEPVSNGNIPENEERNLSMKIEQVLLNRIIEARMDEIIKNVWNQIQLSGYSNVLDAGIVITGGGALLRDLPQFIMSYTGKGVRLARAKVWENQTETYLSPANSCVAGLAILGKENCVKEIKPTVREVREVRGTKVETGSIFKDDEIEVVEKPNIEKDKNDNKKNRTNFIKTGFNKIRDIFDEGAASVLDDNTPDNNKNKNSANK